MAIVSALTGANAAKKAADAQQKGFRQGRLALEGAQAEFEPEVAAGDSALNLLSQALGLEGAGAQTEFFTGFQDDPGFQAEVDFANRNTLRAASAAGVRSSGGTLAALNERSQLLKRSSFADRLNRLAGVTGFGTQAKAQRAGLSRSIADTRIGSQQARASGFINANNALTAGIQNTLDLAGKAFGAGF